MLLTIASYPARADVLEIGDDRLYYEDTGQGMPIVLVSGGSGMDIRQWADIVPTLSERNRVIAYDPRGIGKSDNPTVRYSDIADLERLLDHLQLDKVCLVGLSSGGGFVLEFAAAKPDRVDRVVAVAPFIPGFEFSESMQARIDSFASAAQTGKEVFLDTLFSDPHFIPAPADPAVRDRARDIVGFNYDKGAGFDPSLYVAFDPPLIQQLHNIEAPVLLVAGELDHPEVMRRNRFLEQEIQDVATAMVEKSGHTVPVENPTALLAVMIPFLDQAAF